MTIWLLILLVIVVAGALVWRSERRNRQIHGPGGSPDGRGVDQRAAQARYRNEGGGASGGGGGV